MIQIAKNKIISYYEIKYKNGMGLNDIRNDLKNRKVQDAHITDIIRSLDERLLKCETEKTNNNKIKERIWVGYALMLIGGLFGIAGFFNKEAVGNYYLFAWGPILGGYLMIRNARKEIYESKETVNSDLQEPDFSEFTD